MNPKAGHSMMPIDPSTPDREAPKARQARSSRQTALPSATDRDRSHGRTSRPELPASDPLPTRSMRSAKQCHRPCRSLHERKPGSQTKDDIGTEVRDERSCGRSQTSLYNPRRRHSSLGSLSPVEFERRQAEGALDPGAHHPAAVLGAVKVRPGDVAMGGKVSATADLDRPCARRRHVRAGRDEKMLSAEPKDGPRKQEKENTLLPNPLP
jgi:hypothetical protein